MRERDVLKLLSERLPIGDDCAVIPFQKRNLLLTTDMLHRRTDFPEGMKPYAMGWRAVAVSLSDIAAMGGEPLGVVMALGAPEFEKGFIEELLAGALAICDLCKTQLLGGDTDRHDELTIVTTALGWAERPVERRGAQPNDLVCVTGDLGRSAAALKLLAEGETKQAHELFCFTPRLAEGQALSAFVSSMMDISDGLARSLYQLGEASDVGFRIDATAIPFALEIEELARDQDELLEMGLYFGEDFELLFTLPQKHLLEARRCCEFTVIGQVVPKEKEITMQLGSEWLVIEDRGYEH
ncbi:MAG: thiamine-phosphate kinase [Candidatus Bipolaricaulota bacterium]|nr:thiamine-phosphate kinase [Candidatus Bipolaricaulota bacterium]MDW8141597.1 thiamine-phosphate kinase [Candidatus Bipolaricaulota bacterium]